MTIRAADILRLLRAKHSDDIFVSECKNGPTQFGPGMQRLDAWVMPRSWAHPGTTGYEIKISRNDFLRDDKWRGYLDLCNQFYFVCPTGLIQVEELPPDVGLMWVAKTGTRLFTRRKAVHREIVQPVDLWRYVLMSRSVITKERNEDRAQAFRDWLEVKKENRDLGHLVRGRIRDIHAEVKRENDRLTSLMAKYDAIRETMTSMGIDPEHPPTFNREQAVRKALTGIPPDLVRTMTWTRDQITKAIAALESVQNQCTTDDLNA